MDDNRHGKPFLVITIAVLMLCGVSMLPLSQLTGGRLRDFNLLADIVKTTGDSTVIVPQSDASAPVDKALIEAQAEEEQEAVTRHDTLTEPKDDDIQAVDTVSVLPDPITSRQGDIVVMEDYTGNGSGLDRFKAALSDKDKRVVRVAFIGDSYIEGDIFTQNVRESLQQHFGGAGVGYVNMYSEFPGFRRSVRQSGSGWKVFNMGKGHANNAYLSLTEQYSVPDGKAKAVYKGVDKFHNADSWQVSRFLFVSPDNAVITTKVSDGEAESHSVSGSHDVQCIELDSPTSSFSVSTDCTSLAAIGVWLDDATGISVDCMSSRGYSGVTLSKVNAGLSRSMRRYIDYDLIVLEFGINAMSAAQSDYSAYTRLMTKTVAHLRECYPEADFIIMGIGDRGQKSGSEIKSMRVAPAMTSAQRDIARNSHCIFWDTREAMGGENSIVDWANSNPSRANKDYIHLTHKGGAVLAEQFVKSLLHALDN